MADGNESTLYDSLVSECSYRPLDSGKSAASSGDRSARCLYFKVASATLATAIVVGILCTLLAFWLVQPRAFTVVAAIDTSGLVECADPESWQPPCYKRLNGSLLMITGLGQPIAPLSVADAATAAAAVQLSADGSGLRVRRPGLYQVDAQVTFADPELADNAAAFLSVNGRQLAQCHRFSPAGAGPVPCPLSLVRRFAAGDHVTLSADAELRVAADPSLTFLALSELPPWQVRPQPAVGRPAAKSSFAV